MGCCCSESLPPPDERSQFQVEHDYGLNFDYDPLTGCITLPGQHISAPGTRSATPIRTPTPPRPNAPSPVRQVSTPLMTPPPTVDASNSVPPADLYTPRGDESSLLHESGDNLIMHSFNENNCFATVFSSAPRLRARHSETNEAVSAETFEVDSFTMSVRTFKETNTLTEAQQKYIYGDNDGNQQLAINVKLQRLLEVEEFRRNEITSAFVVTSKMLGLARKHVRPMLRRRLMPSSQKDISTSKHISQTHVDPIPSQSFSTKNDPKENVTNVAIQHLQILELSGNSIDINMKVKPFLRDSWDFLSSDGGSKEMNPTKILCHGHALFRFACRPFPKLTDEDMTLYMQPLCNLTGFGPQGGEVFNNVPSYDLSDREANKNVVCILTKTMYIVPGFSNLAALTPDLYCSHEYLTRTLYGKPKMWTDITEPHTFRYTKPLVRFVKNFTIQFRVFVWDTSDDYVKFEQFRHVDGMLPDKVVLFERTKRDKTKVDSVAKLKTLSLYYRITGGVLITHMSVIIATSLPHWMAKMVDTFGKSGAEEGAETGQLARAYLHETFGDSRKS